MNAFHRSLILTASFAALSLGGCSLATKQPVPVETSGDYIYIPLEEDIVALPVTPSEEESPALQNVAAGTQEKESAPVEQVDIAENVPFSNAEPESEASQVTTEDSGEFDMASVTDDAQLSEMRGGFVSMGGLLINLGLVSSTSVNDVVVNKLEFSTVGLNGLLPGNLQQLLQNGSGNQAAVSSSAVPYNVLTVVQNTANNQVIQNQNVLDITVGNLEAFRAQQIAFSQRFAIGR